MNPALRLKLFQSVIHDLIKTKRLKHPYHWVFQLFVDVSTQNHLDGLYVLYLIIWLLLVLEKNTRSASMLANCRRDHPSLLNNHVINKVLNLLPVAAWFCEFQIAKCFRVTQLHWFFDRKEETQESFTRDKCSKNKNLCELPPRCEFHILILNETKQTILRVIKRVKRINVLRNKANQLSIRLGLVFLSMVRRESRE